MGVSVKRTVSTLAQVLVFAVFGGMLVTANPPSNTRSYQIKLPSEFKPTVKFGEPESLGDLAPSEIQSEARTISTFSALEKFSVTVQVAELGLSTELGAARGRWGTGWITHDKLGNTYVTTAAHLVYDHINTKTKTIEAVNITVCVRVASKGQVIKCISYEADVVKVSSANDIGHDICILKLREQNVGESATVGSSKNLVKGQRLAHAGTVWGASNGLFTMDGRVSNIAVNSGHHDFIGTSIGALPGSSGGPVVDFYTLKVVGMLTLGKPGSVNLSVPIDRILKWAKTAGVSFVYDPSLEVPTDEELNKTPQVDGIKEDDGEIIGPGITIIPLPKK